eukprot:m.10180 g.10180  ORF g.10180 m.10180 type:complete len:373 (+) comp22008_c0_seq2:146-1264(+)
MHRLSLPSLFLCLVFASATGTWLELGQKLIEEEIKNRPPGYDPTIVHTKENDVKVTLDCSSVNMTSAQQKMCQSAEKGLIVAIAQGINAAVYSCRRNMANHSWNCPVPGGSHLFGPVYNSGTREAAYLRGILNVAVSYSIVMACADGSMPWTCGCLARTKLPQFDNATYEWGECSHDVNLGVNLGSAFTSAGEVKEEQTKLNYLSNLHNRDVGQKVAREGAKLICRCIGGTFSCATKVCHLELKVFSYFGTKLKEKYDSAVQVKLSKNGERIKNSDSATKPFDDGDFVYGTDGGSLCEPNPAIGYEGVHGRECSKDRTAENYCGSLCCSFGYNTFVERKKKSCRCRIEVIVGCCFDLRCDTCYDDVEKYRCK